MDEQRILKEVKYKAVRSGGPGGQHVNKVSTKIMLEFDLQASEAFDADEKELLFMKLQKQLIKGRLIRISASASRSQLTNKQEATARLISLLEKALIRRKKRKPTKPGKAAVKKRLENKKRQSIKKILRSKPGTTEN